jgi:hypothetical protein
MQSRCSSIRAASAGTRQKDLGLCWSRQIALPPGVPIPKLASTSGTLMRAAEAKGHQQLYDSSAVSDLNRTGMIRFGDRIAKKDESPVTGGFNAAPAGALDATNNAMKPG